MAQVSILRRSRSLSVPAVGLATDVVEVTYSTPAIPPRHVHLPFELYRAATPDELAANPRYQMLPIDPAAENQEKLEIERDMKAAVRSVPQTFEAT